MQHLQTEMKKVIISAHKVHVLSFKNSMHGGIVEICILSKRFRRFLGATAKNMHNCIIPLINK